MKHQFWPLSVCCAVIFFGDSATAQGTFQNLSFEKANLPYLPPGQFGDRVSASNALPGWTVYGGYTYPDVLYNNEALDSASISILTTNYLYGVPDLASGTYYVKLRGASYDPTLTSAIGQTAQIPVSAISLLLDGYYSPTVTFAGISIPMVEIGPRRGPYASSYGADISAFAGQVGELRFSGFSYFDNIRFSSQPIPEPSTLLLAMVGVGVIYFRSKCATRRRRAGRMLPPHRKPERRV
jgi:hypothetical protein